MDRPMHAGERPVHVGHCDGTVGLAVPLGIPL